MKQVERCEKAFEIQEIYWKRPESKANFGNEFKVNSSMPKVKNEFINVTSWSQFKIKFLKSFKTVELKKNWCNFNNHHHDISIQCFSGTVMRFKKLWSTDHFSVKKKSWKCHIHIVHVF